MQKFATLILLWLALSVSAVAQSQNVSRVVATAADLVAQPPETLASTLPGAALSFVTTTGDVTPGTGKKSWYWAPSAALATNTAANNGPIAYPWGSGTGRWLFVPESGAGSGTISGGGTNGEVAIFTGPSAVASIGISTNTLRNTSRVVLTSAELVAQSPAELAATTGGSLAFVTTTGDLIAGTGVRHWRWNSGSTTTTNTAAAGGPIAYPYGGATGRWEAVATASLPAASYRLMTIPALYPDAADGSPNATDPVTSIQSYYNSASAAYDAVLGPVVLDHPSGSFTGGELIFKSNVIYNSDGWFHYKKRYDTSGGAQRSTATTSRIGFANLDPVDGNFLSWGAAGGTNAYYAVADRWYAGQAANITFTGKGKFIFDQNGKTLGQPNVRVIDAENWVVLNGCVESWITSVSDSGPGNSYGFGVGARGLYWERPIVRGGTALWQDGFHAFSGRDWVVFGGYIESGDDALPFEVEASGGSTLPPDEWMERVTMANMVVNSKRARGIVITGGVNTVSVPYVNGGLKVRDIHVTGVTGKCAQERQHAIGLGSYQEAYSIWNYTFTGGSGYTDGYYTNLPVASVGGGSGAKCTVKVVGGSIVRAVMFKSGGTNYIGSSYKQDQVVDISSIPGGSGGSVTGIVFGKPNNLVFNCSITDFHLQHGSATHDGIEPYSLKIFGATDCRIGPGSFELVEGTNNPSWPTNAHRPYMVMSASNVLVVGVKFDATTRGGAVTTTDYPKSEIGGLVFDGITIGPQLNSGNGLMQLFGTNIHSVEWRNSTFLVANTTSAFHFTDYNGGERAWCRSLKLNNNTFIAVPGASVTGAINIVPSVSGNSNVLGYLEFTQNELIGINFFDTPAEFNTGVTAWWIDGNKGGYRTKLQKTITLNSGATTASIPVDTYTGLLDATTASLPQITSVVSYDYLGAFRVRPNTTTAATLEVASAPSSNVVFGVTLDTSRKPLTGY